MPYVLAALVLLFVQQLSWRVPAAPSAAAGSPPPVASLLADANSTAEASMIVGRVVDASPTWGEGVRLTIDAETVGGVPVTGFVNVSLRETSRRWRTGDRLQLRSRLRRITGFGNFGELDWSAYNARRGIFASASAWRDEEVEQLAARDGIVDRLRRTFSESCARVGGQGAEILEALVIGDRTGIDMVTSIAVRDAGLAHFLAISGSHMALIVAIVVAFVRRGANLRPVLLERFDVMRAAAALAALAVVAYGAICGGGVSVVRSELMALAAMAALWRGRPGDELRALGGSAIMLALAMPGVGEEAGFQLSYLAVIALVIDSRRRRFERAQAVAFAKVTAAANSPGRLETYSRQAVHLLVEAARLTVVCWAVTSPVVAHHFQRISLVAPLANLLAAPLVSAIVICGIAGLVLLPILPWAGDLAVVFGAYLSGLVVRISAWCASLPFAATVTPAPGVALTVAMTGIALLMLLPASRSRLRAVLCLVGVVATLVVLGTYDRFRGDRLDVWFASVGQGDAAIVRMPGGKVWVIDEGPPGRGRMVVAPLLRRAWILRVDVLVASHVQSDHAGAMAEILEDFDVGEVWLPDGPCDIAAAHAIEHAAEVRGVPVRFVSNRGVREMGEQVVPGAAANGGAISVDDAVVLFDDRGRTLKSSSDAASVAVSPQSPNAAASSASAVVTVVSPSPGAAACNDNDQSLVMRIDFAGRSILFTGDIEARAEARVAAGAQVHADVLKVPHHGSRTSSTETFLSAVRPTLAVASLGLDNQFHFPAPEVLARYAEHGTKFLRTDRTGSVHVRIRDDNSIDLEMFHPD